MVTKIAATQRMRLSHSFTHAHMFTYTQTATYACAAHTHTLSPIDCCRGCCWSRKTVDTDELSLTLPLPPLHTVTTNNNNNNKHKVRRQLWNLWLPPPPFAVDMFIFYFAPLVLLFLLVISAFLFCSQRTFRSLTCLFSLLCCCL